MRSFATLTVISVVCLAYTHAQTAIDLCAGCTMVNGAGYNKHPTDCDKFVQCHYDANGVLVGEVQQCAFSTYWNMGLLTCLPAEQSPCPNDKCRSEVDDMLFPGRGNCRGFWVCQGERSLPRCCPEGHRYDEALGCVEDKDCEDRCFNEQDNVQVCDKRAVAGNLAAFEQFVEGWGWIQQPCAPGTIFSQDECLCGVFDVTVVQKRICKPEVYLPFTQDHKDQSGNNYYVGNENVDIIDGVANFTGNSRLFIPRFTNLEHSSTIVIKAKYSSDHSEASSGIARALVSNSDCGNLPSIMISEDASSIYYGIGTSVATFAYTYVPQEVTDPANPTTTKEVTYVFDDGVLTGSNGAVSDSLPVAGTLRNVQCALHIGHAENLSPFVGEIDEMTIYLCNPDKP